jgi:hypothetical protein
MEFDADLNIEIATAHGTWVFPTKCSNSEPAEIAGAVICLKS